MLCQKTATTLAFLVCQPKDDWLFFRYSKINERIPRPSPLSHTIALGILEKTTGRERHRLFVYRRYLDILNEGTEPLR